MEVKEEILQKLKCSVCHEFLTCAPVRMKFDGTVICGRCYQAEDEPTLRITPYEQLAECVQFPCKNKSHGCPGVLQMSAMKHHEETCKYQQ